MNCPAKHTKFQPSDEQWRCPHCGDNAYNFYIESYQDEADPDCGKVHVGDYVVCTSCKSDFTGDQATKAIAKNLHMTTCPHCKGSGFVKKEDGL